MKQLQMEASPGVPLITHIFPPFVKGAKSSSLPTSIPPFIKGARSSSLPTCSPFCKGGKGDCVYG